MFTTKKTASSFGPDGRRISGPPPPRFTCVGRAGSGFSSNPASSNGIHANNTGGGCGSTGGSIILKSTNKLFQPGRRLHIARAPVMSGLSVNGGTSLGLQRKFQRPMTKRRSYDTNAELALKTSTLGQKRRFDGMAKLLARAGKGLSYTLPNGGVGKGGECSGTSDESDSDEGGKEEDRPFEPLLLWKSPHQGGEAKGLPPRL